ncbi:MAG: pyridoxal phosphate-dependent aminotransferase, partial [Bryobacteraceae bacterium]
DRIILTASTSEAYSYLFKLLADPEDEILVPRPSYPLFDFLAALEMVRVIHYPLEYDGDWRFDVQALSRHVTGRTRAVVLVNPNNPTGSFLKRGELRELETLCRERSLAIISDEVFSEYAFEDDPGRAVSLSSVDSVLTFTLDGLSKAAGLPQMKLAWIRVNGPPQMVADALSRLELISDTYLSVSTPVQHAVPALLKAGEDVRQQIRERTAGNLTVLRSLISPQSPARLLHVEGGWYATLQLPRIRPEEEWVIDLLEQQNTLVQPGFFYDFASEAFVILSLLTKPPVFREGAQRLLRFAG